MDSALRQALRAGEQLGLRYALQIPQVAASGWTGSRSGRRAGSSIDFQDYANISPATTCVSLTGAFSRDPTGSPSNCSRRGHAAPRLDSRRLTLHEFGGHREKPALWRNLPRCWRPPPPTRNAPRPSGCLAKVFKRLPNDTLTPSAWDKLELESKAHAGPIV